MLNLTNYDRKYGTDLRQRVEDLRREAKDLQASEGEQRLKLVADNFFKLSFEQAYTLLDPVAFRREVEEHQSYRLWAKIFQYIRVFLGLAPLIVTWTSLSFAVLAYSSTPNKANITFLQAWQAGLPGDPFTFAWTGFIDVALLILFLIFNVLALVFEYRARSRSESFASNLQQVIDGLMEAVIKEGLNDVSSDVQIQRIVRFIKEAIAESYQDLGEIVEKSRDTIVRSGEEMKDLLDLQIKPLLNRFDTNIQNFQNDLNTLNNKVASISGASQSMANAADTMSKSSGDLASNIQAQTGISKDIDAHLVDLGKTEQAMTTTMVQAGRAVAGDVQRAANDVKMAAERLENIVGRVENVGRQLTSVKPNDIQKITESANMFAYQASQAATQLQNAARALDTAANATRRRRWFF